MISSVESVDEAVALANQSEYSLMAAVWTKDVYNAYGTAARIHSGGCHKRLWWIEVNWCIGSVNINGPTIHTEMGMAGSGVGSLRGLG